MAPECASKTYFPLLYFPTPTCLPIKIPQINANIRHFTLRGLENVGGGHVYLRVIAKLKENKSVVPKKRVPLSHTFLLHLLVSALASG